MEDVHQNKKLLYSLARSYRKGDKETVSTVKDENGNLSTDEMQIEQRWREYFLC